MFGAFQGDNLMHGFCCRLEAVLSGASNGNGGVDHFCLMHTLHNSETLSFKVWFCLGTLRQYAVITLNSDTSIYCPVKNLIGLKLGVLSSC